MDSRSESYSTTMGMSTAGGISGSATASNSESHSESTMYRNATASAGGTFTVKTKGDASFRGANVVADVVDMADILEILSWSLCICFSTHLIE